MPRTGARASGFAWRGRRISSFFFNSLPPSLRRAWERFSLGEVAYVPGFGGTGERGEPARRVGDIVGAPGARATRGPFGGSAPVVPDTSIRARDAGSGTSVTVFARTRLPVW